MQADFKEKLQTGKMGENLISAWFQQKGYSILPVYETEGNDHKGPRMFAGGQQLIAPDIFVFRGSDAYWIEAKHKTRFSWHGKTRRWVTGIDIKHYEHYKEVDVETPWPVWLLFLHKDSTPWTEDISRWNCPNACPVGLFGNTLDRLRNLESHRDLRWGKHGMVYWARDNLLQIASAEEVERLQQVDTS